MTERLDKQIELREAQLRVLIPKTMKCGKVRFSRTYSALRSHQTQPMMVALHFGLVKCFAQKKKFSGGGKKRAWRLRRTKDT